MPKVPKGRRKRAYGPKTRSGCPTCRVRRVKCDETQPFCFRCTSTGRVCDGYSHTLAEQSLNPPTLPPAVMISISCDAQDSHCAKRSFDFFVRRTCLELAGFFGSEFWQRLVLQAAYHEPAIRHAVVALGSLHELVGHQTLPTDTNPTFALRQYNLAIQYLLDFQSISEERRVTVYLISCILFICFENMQGNHALVATHIRNGAKLLLETIHKRGHSAPQLQSLWRKGSMDSYAPLDMLAELFAGLNLEVAMIIPNLKLHLYNDFLEAVNSDVPLKFDTIGQARNFFEYCYCLFVGSHAAQPFAGFELPTGHVTMMLSKILSALQELRESQSLSSTPKDKTAMNVLQLHVLDAYVSFHGKLLPPHLQSSWDDLQPQMERMIALSEEIVSALSGIEELQGQNTSFCMDRGYVIPLYTVASNCRDPIIRRSAVAILRSKSRQEGLWKSSLIAKAAERIIEIEEDQGKAAEECTDTWDLVTSPNLYPFLELDGTGGRLRYVRRGDKANGLLGVVEEVFRW